MRTLIWIALLLLALWLVLRLGLAITGAALHLLWIAAIVMFALWVFNQLRGRPSA